MEIKDNDDITMVQALVLCLLVLVCIILSLYCICYGINLAMTAWVSVGVLMTLGFIVNIVSAIR